MTQNSKPRVIALGTFDGLHPGHRAVIECCRESAREMGAVSMVYTFWENPRSLFGKAPLNILSPARKICAILEMGVDEVACDHFTKELSALSPEAFVEMLIKRFQPAAFVCGEDYSFGAGAMGTSGMLEKMSRERGLTARIVPTVHVLSEKGAPSQKVSSTLIRSALLQGDEERAEKLLRGEAIQE